MELFQILNRRDLLSEQCTEALMLSRRSLSQFMSLTGGDNYFGQTATGSFVYHDVRQDGSPHLTVKRDTTATTP